MADTNFVDGSTTILASWLNDVNDHTYNTGGVQHPANAISLSLVPGLSSTDVQGAIAELAAGAGGGGGDVLSVQGKTGIVTLAAADFPDIYSKTEVDSLIGTGGGVAGVTLVNGKDGVVTLVASDFSDMYSKTEVDAKVAAIIGSSLGSGSDVFKQKVGNEFQFRSLVAGTGITLAQGTSDITINAAGGSSGGVLGTGYLQPTTSTVSVGSTSFVQIGSLSYSKQSSTSDLIVLMSFSAAFSGTVTTYPQVFGGIGYGGGSVIETTKMVIGEAVNPDGNWTSAAQQGSGYRKITGLSSGTKSITAHARLASSGWTFLASRVNIVVFEVEP